jgi:dTDP-4-amino-4,6-dideoxygalactose transaminase
VLANSTKPAILAGSPAFPDGLNLVRPDLPDLSSLLPDLDQILASGILTKGPYLEAFEKEIATLAGTKHAVGLSSCTIGIVLVHKILLNRGTQIVMPSFTFLASALGAVWNGLQPVFVDIESDTWNVDPLRVREAINENTAAVLATHVFGNPASVKELEDLSADLGVPLIFDAAHALGSHYQGKPLGGNGNCEVFSCSPTKLVVAGEGGVVTTNDSELAHHLLRSREYGNVGNYDLVLPGLNGRMSEINALLAQHCLPMLEQIAQRRNQLAHALQLRLATVPGITWQHVKSGNRSSYKDLTLMVDEKEFGLTREELVQVLSAEGVTTRSYYDPPCHEQTYWKGRAAIGASGLSVTERVSKTALTLPLSSRMRDDDMEQLAECIIRAHHLAATIKKACRQ